MAASTWRLDSEQGETLDEVAQTLEDLRGVGTDVITFGQYLQPTPKHLAVAEFVTPEQFDTFGALARDMGFLYVASGPLVRSSYRAGELFLTNHIQSTRSRRAERA